MNGLNDFDIPTNDNPRNQHFATQLFSKYGSATKGEKSEQINTVKRKNEYAFVEGDMNLKNKKILVNDR